jgi:hypothetical protein
MTNFKKRTPVSSDAIWTDIYDDEGINYGKFKVKYMNLDSPEYLLKYRRAADQLSQSEKIRADAPKTPEDVLIRRRLVLGILAADYIVDSAILDADDQPMEHSFATVTAFITDPEYYFVAQELDRFATNASNFKAKEAAAVAKKN